MRDKMEQDQKNESDYWWWIYGGSYTILFLCMLGKSRNSIYRNVPVQDAASYTYG